jgi:hypothetical protein
LFESTTLVDDAVRAIEAIGFPRKEVRTLTEPANFPVTGVMSFPRLDFEADLSRELTRIGATVPETRAYMDGLRRGGALAFATGSDEKVEEAACIMNLFGAVEIEELTGAEPHMPTVHHGNPPSFHDDAVLAGRVRQTGGGAHCFVW